MFKLKALIAVMLAAAFVSCNGGGSGGGPGAGGGAGNPNDGTSLSDSIHEEASYQPESHLNPLYYQSYKSQNCDSASRLASLSEIERATYCLRKICEETAYASFDMAALECRCPDGQTFRAENGGGSCLSNIVEQAMFGRANLRVESGVAFDIVSTDFATIEADNDWLLEWQKSYLATGNTGFKGGFLDRATYFTVRDVKSLAALSRDEALRFTIQLLNSFEAKPAVKIDVIGSAGKAKYYFEPNIEFMEAALGDVRALAELTEQQRASFNSVAGQNPDFKPLSQLQYVLREAYNKYRAQKVFNLSKVEAISAAGCAEYCVATADLFIAGSSDYSATFEKVYFLGVASLQRIVLRQRPDGRVAGVVLLNHGGSASAIATVEKPGLVDYAGKSYRNYIRLFDRSWNLLGTSELYPVIDVAEKLQQASRYLTKASDVKGAPVGIVCEEWDPSQLSELPNKLGFQKRLVLGPHFSASLPKAAGAHGTFNGWRKTNSGDLDDYFLSVTQKRPLLGSYPAPSRHSSWTQARFLGDDLSGYVIPLAWEECTSARYYEQWKKAVFETGARVASISIVDYAEKAQCAQKYRGVFDDPEKPFLWVVAAANHGIMNPRLNCPQGILAGSDNALIVAAMSTEEPEKLATYSDAGSRFADIAYPTGNLRGTSFAAPAVARIAANIASAYPKMSVPMIRLSILMGARIPKLWQPLAVRSGGIADNEKALEVAALIDEFPERSVMKNAKKILNYAFCGSRYACSESNARYALLKKTEVLK